MSLLKKYFGPSTLIAAAFIGPGTVTTCTLAGVQTGYSLLWALAFSIVATIIFQEMSARLGWVTRSGLGEAITTSLGSSGIKYFAIFLVTSAILIGNAAYEAGNLSGGVLGIELLIGPQKFWPLVMGGICFLMLSIGKYRLVEKLLIGLVITMSICFAITAILVQPDLGAVLQGFIPRNPEEDLLLVLALLGTTVVPYNLFLHASTISKKWESTASLREIRAENRVSILMGGLISILIVITAGTFQGGITEVKSGQDLAVQLEPLFGSAAKYCMGVGLLAAGLSSALTAPLAAGYAAQGLFNWPKDEEDIRFRMVWMIILGLGIVVSTIGLKPILVIKFAQIANALLLPFIAVFLIYVSNSKKLLQKHINNKWQNTLAIGVLFITIILSLKSLNKIFQFI